MYGINLKYHDQATKFRKRSSDAMEATMYRSLKNSEVIESTYFGSEYAQNKYKYYN